MFDDNIQEKLKEAQQTAEWMNSVDRGRQTSCSSPSACSEPDYTAIWKRMKHMMEAHPWWRKRIDGTPLATDLPVRAAVECIEIIRELQNTPRDFRGA